MISSLSNTKVKKVRRLQTDRRFRSNQRQFVVEGTRWAGELVNNPALQDVFYTENWYDQADHAALIAKLQRRSHPVTAEVMAAMSTTETPPGIVAVVDIEPLPIPPRPTLLLILDGITNPGNLGTMLRSAAAAGVDAVLLSPGSVDVYNPKVVRGSMGALLRLPVHQLGWDDIAQTAGGTQIWSATAKGDRVYTAVNWRQPSALVIGNEAHGVSETANNLAAGSVSIPMSSETESLNAAAAAGIILFEAVRQRNRADDNAGQR